MTPRSLEPLIEPSIVHIHARGGLLRFVRASWSRCQNHRLCTSMPVGDSCVLSGLLGAAAKTADCAHPCPWGTLTFCQGFPGRSDNCRRLRLFSAREIHSTRAWPEVTEAMRSFGATRQFLEFYHLGKQGSPIGWYRCPSKPQEGSPFLSGTPNLPGLRRVGCRWGVAQGRRETRSGDRTTHFTACMQAV